MSELIACLPNISMSDPKVVQKVKKLSPPKMTGGGQKSASKEISFEKRVLDTRSEMSGDFVGKVLHDHLRMENSYRMVPDDEQRFKTYKVEHLMKDMLERRLEGVAYDGAECGILAKELSAEIRLKVKDLKWFRHKVVVQVLVGQDSEQSVQFGSRCLWDKTTDNFACARYTNDNLFAVAACFGIYYE